MNGNTWKQLIGAAKHAAGGVAAAEKVIRVSS